MTAEAAASRISETADRVTMRAAASTHAEALRLAAPLVPAGWRVTEWRIEARRGRAVIVAERAPEEGRWLVAETEAVDAARSSGRGSRAWMTPGSTPGL